MFTSLYLTFEAYPIVFGAHGFNAGITGLMFLDLFVGASVSTALYIFVFEKRYRKKAAALAPEPVPPEARLEMTLLAAPLFSASFFWFGWTSYTSIHWASPLCAGGLLGFAIMAIFVSLFNYVSCEQLSEIQGRIELTNISTLRLWTRTCLLLPRLSLPTVSLMVDGTFSKSVDTLTLCFAIINKQPSVDPSWAHHSHSLRDKCLKTSSQDGQARSLGSPH